MKINLPISYVWYYFVEITMFEEIAFGGIMPAILMNRVIHRPIYTASDQAKYSPNNYGRWHANSLSMWEKQSKLYSRRLVS